MGKYIEIKTEAELEAWINRNYTKTQLDYLKASVNNVDSPLFFFVGEGHRRINRELRNNSQQENGDSRIDELQRIVSSFSVSENIITYRYVDKNEYRCFRRKTAFKRTYVYPCFCSTTLIKDLYSIDEIKCNRRVIKIYIPKGTQCVYIPEAVENSPEYELLLPYHTKFKRLDINSFIVEQSGIRSES